MSSNNRLAYLAGPSYGALRPRRTCRANRSGRTRHAGTPRSGRSNLTPHTGGTHCAHFTRATCNDFARRSSGAIFAPRPFASRRPLFTDRSCQARAPHAGRSDLTLHADRALDALSAGWANDPFSLSAGRAYGALFTGGTGRSGGPTRADQAGIERIIRLFHSAAKP